MPGRFWKPVEEGLLVALGTKIIKSIYIFINLFTPAGVAQGLSFEPRNPEGPGFDSRPRAQARVLGGLHPQCGACVREAAGRSKILSPSLSSRMSLSLSPFSLRLGNQIKTYFF